MKSNRSLILFGSVATAAIMISAAEPASAQAREGTAADNPNTLNEVVVTAQKREERLQDVPISVAVLGGEQLDASTGQGLTEALTRVPGVAINETYQGGGTQVSIRGVTAGGALFSGANPVAYYLDSVPFGFVRQAIGPDLNPYDLERVEVLRGPQGTLYGASSQNGVVRVLTRDADPSGFEFKSRAMVSDTKGGTAGSRLDMAVNIPLVEDRLAVRAVFGYQDLGGWIDRPNQANANDAEIKNARFKVHAGISDALAIDASAWFSRADYGGPSVANRDDVHFSLVDEPIDTDFDAYNLRVTYDLTFATLTSATSYLEYSNKSFFNVNALVPGRVGRTILDAQTFAQEVVLNSTHAGPWRWSAGAIYRDAEDRQFQDNKVNGVPVGFPGDQTYISRSYALFGQVTRLLLDEQLELTVGLRYFEDEVTNREDSRANGAPASQLVRRKDKFDKISPRFALTWHPLDDLTVYASYAQGFRSGVSQYGSVLGAFPNFPSADADTLHNYEVGAKGDLADGRLSFDAAVYYIEWQDVQQSLTVPVSLGASTLTTALINAESASGLGFDLGVTARPVEGLSIGASVSANDLTVDDRVVSANVVLLAKGDRLNFSPKYTVAGFANYEFPLGGDGLMGEVSATVNYTSEMEWNTIAGGARNRTVGDEILTANLSFSIKSDHWEASVFANNVNNERGSPTRFAILPVFTDFDGRIRPRTIGVQLEYRY